MNKDQAIRRIRKIAKANNLSVSVDMRGGKGSHARIKVGNLTTTLPQTVGPPLFKAILKQLNLKE